MSGAAQGPVLVTGAAGKTGLAVIRALTRRGEPVRALVRSPAQGERAAAAGAGEIAVGDLREASAVVRVVVGARAVYLICPNMSPDEERMARNVIDAGQAAGVNRLVYHSVLHPQIEAMPHHWAKMRVEERLIESGLAWTILQPAAYMQNLLKGWQTIVGQGLYRIPYARETRLGMVDLADVAEVAAEVLVDDGHESAIYELASGENLDQVEVAQALSRALGRRVAPQVEPRAVWRQEALAAGLPARAAEMLVAMFRHYERHGFHGNPVVLTHLLGRPPARLADFLARTVRRLESG